VNITGVNTTKMRAGKFCAIPGSFVQLSQPVADAAVGEPGRGPASIAARAQTPLASVESLNFIPFHVVAASPYAGLDRNGPTGSRRRQAAVQSFR
jgi:hypothetical protein